MHHHRHRTRPARGRGLSLGLLLGLLTLPLRAGEFEQAYPVADFEPAGALLLGCTDLIEEHPQVFADVVGALRGSVELIGLVKNEEQARACRTALAGRDIPTGAIRLLKVPINSMWLRDYGPIFSRRADGGMVLVDAGYSDNDSGDRWDDDAFPILLANLLDLPLEGLPLRLEAGNFLSNGDGLCVSSSRVIWKNERLGYDTDRIGQILARRFRLKSWTYLKLPPDEPTEHADMFMTFLAPDLVVVGAVDAERFPENAALLDRAAAVLARLETRCGPMRVHRVRFPVLPDGHWRSYTNVVMANQTLLVPRFTDVDPGLQADATALYRRLLPGWRVREVTADTLVPTRGLLHCFTLPVPRDVDTAPLASRYLP